MSLSPLSPAQAENLMKLGARLIDVRAADAHARTSIPGAENIPLDQLSARTLNQPEHQAVIFHCQSGLRTTTSASVLQASTNASAYVLEGGIDNWRKHGLPVTINRKQPLELSRQVHLTVGLLIVVATVLGALVSPWIHAAAGLIGVGLFVAGATGFCGMARLLQKMPWNHA